MNRWASSRRTNVSYGVTHGARPRERVIHDGVDDHAMRLCPTLRVHAVEAGRRKEG
jgi:hypothetical protein